MLVGALAEVKAGAEEEMASHLDGSVLGAFAILALFDDEHPERTTAEVAASPALALRASAVAAAMALDGGRPESGQER